MTVNPAAIIRCQYSNHLGSASLELDETADIISYEEYHPFGTTSYRSGRTETETSQKRYKYVGKERDEETGLYYYGFRYYAAWLCRFVSVDPLQFDYPHYTPFQYAGNKPITYIDLDGLEEVKYDVNSDRYYDSRHPNSVSCLVTNQYSLTGRPVNYETYTPDYKVPSEVMALSLAPMAIGLAAVAAPAIAAEATLIGGTSWSSLPAVQSYITAATSASMLSRGGGVVIDATGQFVPEYINNGFDFKRSVNKINLVSLTATFFSPEAKASSTIFNGFISSSFILNPDGNSKVGDLQDIVVGTVLSASFDVKGAKIGDGSLQRGLIKSNNKWGVFNNAVTRGSANPLFQYGEEGGGKYFKMQLDRLFREARTTDMINNTEFMGISLGTQILKNETITLTNYINELNNEND
ncbi:RHS repeat-associated core domain-containing protein [Labilibaculum manganireducens]|uniref:RHS repeat-associated core domain-containing protein n=1 Tax=Labilibaculum manganireducens TaxID=1940525 RepID=UPI0029F52DEE|nr:RHS repeat-associated core domain-containing protein [Labilibaculum manganireducens]